MPVVSSEMPVLARTLAAALVDAFQTRPAAPLIGGAQVALFTAGPFPIAPNSVAGDFTECDFTGYTQHTLATLNTVNLPSNDGLGGQANVQFVSSGSAVANNVLGYFLLDADNNFLMGETFNTPIPINTAGDFIDLAIFIPVAFSLPIS